MKEASKTDQWKDLLLPISHLKIFTNKGNQTYKSIIVGPWELTQKILLDSTIELTQPQIDPPKTQNYVNTAKTKMKGNIPYNIRVDSVKVSSPI